jgi:hypothetical protein
MTLVEKEIDDLEPHRMSLVERDRFRPEYLALNPKAQIPALVRDGKVIRHALGWVPGTGVSLENSCGNTVSCCPDSGKLMGVIGLSA